MYKGCDLGTLQEGEQSLTDFLQGGGGEVRTGDQEQVQPWGDVWDEWTHRFTQKSLCPVALHCCPDRPACRDPHANARPSALLAFQHNQHNKRVGIGLTGTPHPLDIFGSGQTEPSLHPRLLRAGLPADLFHVFVHLNGQSMAAAQATTLEHGASVSRGHALAETMHAHTTADLRLIRSLWHTSFLVSKIITNSMSMHLQDKARNYTVRASIRSIQDSG
jgi:hypothetical protein